MPAFAVVGLPDAAVREARERVRAALANSGFEFPQKRITANLAPADLRKAGPGFDLAIAAAVLAATEQLPEGALADVALAGELALDGSIRAIPGTLAMAEAASRAGARAIVVPAACGARGGAGRRLRRRSRSSGSSSCGVSVATPSRPPPEAAAHVPERRAAGCPTSPTCAASRPCAARSRSPPPAATAC